MDDELEDKLLDEEPEDELPPNASPGFCRNRKSLLCCMFATGNVAYLFQLDLREWGYNTSPDPIRGYSEGNRTNRGGYYDRNLPRGVQMLEEGYTVRKGPKK
jgi:hypothetical protein